ncbi:beta-galactosidase [Melaminivora suipulveris]|uniref:beta-galactosidase n=1 Tax=Melaminivora suipulveris TaxID=2109913 RepID=UPI001F1B4A17|nr:beta-galactosidase [Melaminivora suipulveris]
MMVEPRTPLAARLAALLSAAAVIAAGAGGALWYHAVLAPHPQPSRLLLAPMIGVVDSCIAPAGGKAPLPTSLVQACLKPDGSAGALVESTLSALDSRSPSSSGRSSYELGYTLAVPLLALFQQVDGHWRIDEARLRHIVNTVRDVRRPVVLYLFSTHFAADAPIEEELAREPGNLAQTQQGTLERDRYYDSYIYPWSVASTRNTLTARRAEAMQAVLDAACRLEPDIRERIRAVTLLGEVHQLFPRFQDGMGYESAYRISDYSSVSVQEFREFLAKRWRHIDRLNRVLGTDYRTFDEVDPPSKDIRTQRLTRFADHIDPYAHGRLPVAGWAYVADAPHGYVPRVHVYLDGHAVARAHVDLDRQDVLAARPDFAGATTGWRTDLDLRRLAPGLHRLDLFLEDRPGHLVALGQREIALMTRDQRPPARHAQRALPAATPSTQAPQVHFHVDSPRDQSDYYYNPLATLWHEFRAQQVLRYLAYFSAQVQRSCLADVPRYTHQIVPFANPGWDGTRFAIEDSLRPPAGLNLGVSLYGEAAFGNSFSRWLRRTGTARYGITEFHPLRAMDPQALDQAFQRHARQGAQFLSFFLEPEWQGERVPRGHNLFSFDPQNREFGSDVLYRSVGQLLLRGAPVNRKPSPP